MKAIFSFLTGGLLCGYFPIPDHADITGESPDHGREYDGDQVLRDPKVGEATGTQRVG